MRLLHVQDSAPKECSSSPVSKLNLNHTALCTCELSHDFFNKGEKNKIKETHKAISRGNEIHTFPKAIQLNQTR